MLTIKAYTYYLPILHLLGFVMIRADDSNQSCQPTWVMAQTLDGVGQDAKRYFMPYDFPRYFLTLSITG